MEDASDLVTRRRPRALALFLVGLGVAAASTLAAIAWNWSYVRQLAQFPAALAAFDYTPVEIGGLPGALLGALQILLLGSIVYRFLFPRAEDGFGGKVLAGGLGLGTAAAVATPLSLLRLLTLWNLEIALLAVAAFLGTVSILLTPTRPRDWLRSLLDLWRVRIPHLTRIELLLVVALAATWTLLAYDALFYPVSETDSLIYHSSLAAILYYHQGLPWIVGGGVGLSSSANYPQAFSVLGASFYFWTAGVNDIYLRLLGVVSGLLSVLGIFLTARLVGGRTVAFLAAFLASTVPSYLSYATLATQETTLVMFGSLGFYAFLRSLEGTSIRWAATAGLFYGFACLTSYQGLYLAGPLVVVLVVRLVRTRSLRDVSTRASLLACLVTALVGAAPYVRNAVLLQNPIYPFMNRLFPSPYVSPRMLAYNDLEWQGVARFLVSMSPTDPSWLNFFVHWSAAPAFLPLNLLVAVPALLVLPIVGLRHWRSLALFFLVTTGLILAGPVLFVRYLWLLLPIIAVAFAGMVAAAGAVVPSIAGRFGRTSKSRRLASRLPVLAIVPLLCIPITVGFAGNAYSYVYQESPYPLFRYFSHPGINPWDFLQDAYGSDVTAWRWLNANLRPGERVASLEIRVYYVSQVLRDPGTMMYLDSQEAEPLLDITDPANMVDFLQGRGVTYIFVRVMDWGGVYADVLPLFDWLGSPDFPPVFFLGLSVVYHVGAQSSPYVDSEFGIYLSGLEGPVPIGGDRALVLPSGSLDSRVSVETSGRIQVVTLDYWDGGEAVLDINVVNPVDGRWYGAGQVVQGNTDRWLDYSFVVPFTPAAKSVVFGLHAWNGDFQFRSVRGRFVVSTTHGLYGNLTGLTISNATTPPALFVYLPILTNRSVVTASAHVPGGNLSIDVFGGYISPDRNTSWWTSNPGILRVPPLPMWGEARPSIDWAPTEGGIYTLVVALWSAWSSGLELQVSLDVSL